jgi:hypothetical protein
MSSKPKMRAKTDMPAPEPPESDLATLYTLHHLPMTGKGTVPGRFAFGAVARFRLAG